MEQEKSLQNFAGATLTVDVGGTGIKAMILDARGEPASERVRRETPRPATPENVLATILELVAELPYFDRVAVGFPGVVTEDIVRTAPMLDGHWRNYPLGRELSLKTEKMVRVANDADVHGLAVVEGRGVEMVLTFGTSLGSALFVDGRLVPNLELAHHPFKKRDTYGEYVGRMALRQVGIKRWNKRIQRVLEQIQPIWNPRLIHLGGGNAKKIRIKLPENVRVVANEAGLFGGYQLWRDALID